MFMTKHFHPRRPALSSLVLAALAGACAAGVTPAFAVDAATPGVTSLSPLVVTGTRTERTLDDTPIRTEVVTREEIERTHARTLTQALENIPGLQLREIHGKSGYELSLQGLSSDQVLVLVDGLPITPSTGSTVDLSQYLLADVDHIEVVKGAASAQYGSAAMGGVINVITRRPEPGMRGHIAGDLGSYGSQNPSGGSAKPASRHGQFLIEGGSEQWRLRATADVLDDDGFTTDRDGWTRQGDDVRRQQYALRADYLHSARQQYWIEGSTYREDVVQRSLGETKPPYYIAPQVRKNEHIKRNRLNGGAQWKLDSGLGLQLKGVAERYDSTSQSWTADTLTTDREARQDMRHVTAQVDLPRWRNQLWQIGADYHHETLKQTNNGIAEFTNGKVKRSSNELFVQNDIFLNDTWELLLGARWQDDSDFGRHFAPKASLRGDVLDTGDWKGVLRVSFGQGYRVPNLKERYYVFDHSALSQPYMVLGNPNLKPESSNSLQLGGTLTFREDLSFEANLFHNRVKDLIQIDTTNSYVANGVTVYSYRNIARARTQGVETTLRWKASAALTLTAGYTFTATKDLDTGSELTRRPRHVARFGVDWRVLPETLLTTRVRYQSRELVSSGDATYGTQSNVAVAGHSPAWTTVDMALNQQLTPQLTAFVGVNNLFNKQRDFSSATDFGPARGRFIYVGARYAFGNP